MIGVSRIAEGEWEHSRSRERLVKAAREFEAQLMKELLRPMVHPEDGSGAGADNAIADFAAEALGSGMSLHGGLGIAREIIRSISRNEPGDSNPGVREPHPESAIRSGFK